MTFIICAFFISHSGLRYAKKLCLGTQMLITNFFAVSYAG